MSKRGHQPGSCGCCGTCGVFCSDGAVPCLAVAFGPSSSDFTPTADCSYPPWDCTPETSVVPCEPDVTSTTMAGREGGKNTHLADYSWVDTDTYPPEAEGRFCLWTYTDIMPSPECTCHNLGTCTWAVGCDLCDCYWGAPCPPTTNCQTDPTCNCSVISVTCDDGCEAFDCLDGTFACDYNPPNDCCSGLNPLDCASTASSGHCTGYDVPNDMVCQYSCDDSFDGCPGTIDLTVITYRSDGGNVIMAVKLIWGSCTYIAMHDLGASPVDCCNITEELDLVLQDAADECCCTVPSVVISDCCGE